MKQLILMRHGKAVNDSYGKPDFDRALEPKGIRDAELVSKELKSLGIKLDQIFTSTSKRTLSTAKTVAKEFEINESDILGDDHIYDASPTFMKSLIESFDDSLETVIIVGHNPTQTFLIEYYSGQSIGSLPTSGIGIIDFEILSWAEISYNSGYLKKIIIPSKLI